MANVSHEATEAQLEQILQFLTENGQLDERYITTHYLSSCHWMSSYIPSQSLESIQITFAFDLKDPTLSRKRVASSEPALRPTKEPNQEISYWTDLSNQSLISAAVNPPNSSNPAPTVSTSATVTEPSAPEPVPSVAGPSGLSRAQLRESEIRNRRRRKVIEPASLTATTRIVDYLVRQNRHPIPVTFPTPRLTTSGMAEYGVLPNSISNDFDAENEPELEVIRDLEQEEAERERQLILDSQTRREIQEAQMNRDERAETELLKDLELSMEAKDQLDLELELADQRLIQFGPPNKVPREFNGLIHRVYYLFLYTI